MLWSPVMQGGSDTELPPCPVWHLGRQLFTLEYLRRWVSHSSSRRAVPPGYCRGPSAADFSGSQGTWPSCLVIWDHDVLPDALQEASIHLGDGPCPLASGLSEEVPRRDHSKTSEQYLRMLNHTSESWPVSDRLESTASPFGAKPLLDTLREQQ